MIPNVDDFGPFWCSIPPDMNVNFGANKFFDLYREVKKVDLPKLGEGEAAGGGPPPLLGGGGRMVWDTPPPNPAKTPFPEIPDYTIIRCLGVHFQFKHLLVDNVKR